MTAASVMQLRPVLQIILSGAWQVRRGACKFRCMAFSLRIQQTANAQKKAVMGMMPASQYHVAGHVPIIQEVEICIIQGGMRT